MENWKDFSLGRVGEGECDATTLHINENFKPRFLVSSFALISIEFSFKFTYVVYLARYHPFICSPISPIYSILRYPFPLGISLGKFIVTVSSSSEGTILQALMMSWSSTLIVASFRSKLTEFKTTDVVLLHT